MDRTTTEHEVDSTCYNVHCFIHQKDEPRREGKYYSICGECNHTYLTEEELIEAYKVDSREGLIFTLDTKGVAEEAKKLAFEGLEKALLGITADKIYVCPLCSHDF